MCLDSLITTDHTITEGYKVFDTTLGYITAIMFSGYILNGTIHDDNNERIKIPRCRWLEAIHGTISCLDGIVYPCGFHFYETFKGAHEYAKEVGAPWRIMKIEVKEILASGYQCSLESRTDFNKAHVAKHMFILRSVCSSD